MTDKALVYVAPQHAGIESFTPSTPGLDEAVVHVFWSGLSRGTERLVFHGRVPPSEWGRMRAPFQVGEFPYPVRYGYAAVGVVEAGPEALKGRHVFGLFPHQTRVTAPVSALIPLPEGTPPRRAILAANMETALNAVWDAGAAPGDRVAVVGCGVLGALVAGLCAQLPGAEVTVIDPAPERAALAGPLGVRVVPPEGAVDAAAEADVVFHTSAAEAGLALALSLAGVEGVVAELSWYGDAAPRAPLGAAFHSRRLRLISSQVGQVAARRRARWDHRRRLSKAVELLADPRYDALITGEVAFDDLPAALPRLLADPSSAETAYAGLATAIRYDQA